MTSPVPILTALDASPAVLERGLTVPGGPSLHRFIVERVASATGALVFIGELAGEKLDAVEVLAAATPLGAAEVVDYALDGTPCAEVFGERMCVHRAGVQTRFPHDPHLHHLGAEAYLGVRLDDADGRPVGILSAIHTEPLTPERAETLAQLFDALGPRVTADLAHRRVVRDLRKVLELSLSDGDERLGAMTAALARALGVDGAFVIDHTGRNAELAALCFEGELRSIEALEGPLPPQIVVQDGDSSRHGLLRAVSEAQILHAVAVHDGSAATGSVGLLSRRPFSGPVTDGVVFSAFAQRVGRELSHRRAVHERRTAERALSLAQRRETLSVLAGGLAHDFNNLLVSILGNVEALCSYPLEEEAQELTEDIRLAAKRAGEIAKQLLAFTGHSEKKSPLDLSGLVAETCRMLRGQLPAGVSLVVRPAAEPLPVRGNRNQLQQVFMNLLTNASQSGTASIDVHGRRVKNVRLDPRRVAIGPAEIPAAVELAVGDAGRGMERTLIDRIFDPFFTTRPDGHGLGLAAVLGIVRDHAGSLAVESTPGRGTTFRIFLPLDTVAEAAPTPFTVPAEAERRSNPGRMEPPLSLAQRALDRLRDVNGLVAALGMEHELMDGRVVYRMRVTQRHAGSPRAAHGGAVMALMDTALGAMALVYAVERGRSTSTVEMKVNFLRPARIGSTLETDVEIQSAGRSLVVISGHATDERGERIAFAVGTFNLFRGDLSEWLGEAPPLDRAKPTKRHVDPLGVHRCLFRDPVSPRVLNAPPHHEERSVLEG